MRIKKEKINNFLEYIVVLLTILESTSVFSNSNIFPVGILTLLSITVGIYGLFNLNKIKTIHKNKLLIYLAYLIFIFLFMIIRVSKENIFNFFVKFIFIISIFYFNINTKDDIKRIIRCYCNIVCFLCCLSLVMYFFGYVIKLIPVKYNVVLNWGNTKTIGSIFNIHFLIQTENFFGHTFVRNTGVFCEAPTFMLNLIICLTLCLMYDFKKKIYILILIVGVITTLSSIGYILLISLFILKFVSGKKLNIKFIILPIVLIIATTLIINVIESKSSTRSYSVRLDDYVASIEAWKNNIMFGNGYKNNEAFLNNISTFRNTNTGQSSSIGAVLVHGGIYWLILYIMSFISIFRFDNNSKYFALIYLVLFFTIVFQYSAVELLIISIALNLNIIKNKEIKQIEGRKYEK